MVIPRVRGCHWVKESAEFLKSQRSRSKRWVVDNFKNLFLMWNRDTGEALESRADILDEFLDNEKVRKLINIQGIFDNTDNIFDKAFRNL